MGFVRTTQRTEGIEELLDAGLQPISLDSDRIRLITSRDGRRFSIAGISTGLITDPHVRYPGHEHDVLVLAEASHGRTLELGEIACAGVVLERPLTPDEYQSDRLALDGAARWCVQQVLPGELGADGTLSIELGEGVVIYTRLVTG